MSLITNRDAEKHKDSLKTACVQLVLSCQATVGARGASQQAAASTADVWSSFVHLRII